MYFQTLCNAIYYTAIQKRRFSYLKLVEILSQAVKQKHI